MSATKEDTCPCGRRDARGKALPYADCCGRYLDQDTPAPDAESLMRSRYTAFVLGQSDYLKRSWHPSACPRDLFVETGVNWLGLEVRSVRLIEDGRAEVEFVARSRVAGRGYRLHETSRFVREGGRWFYVDGDMH